MEAVKWEGYDQKGHGPCLSTLQTVRLASAWIEEKTFRAAGSIGYYSFLTSPSELYTCMASTEIRGENVIPDHGEPP